MSAMTTDGELGSPVYCAGPMFSIADLWEQRKIAKSLETAGFTTYLPQRDGIEVAKVMAVITTGLQLPLDQVNQVMEFARKIVFALDIYQLVIRCNSLVFNMDGRAPDEGSVVETAIAYAVCKPLVVFKTTPITILGGYDNPMVQGLTTRWQYVNDLVSLPGALRSAIAARGTEQNEKSSLCAHLQAVTDLGVLVWGQIDRIHQAPTLPPEELYQEVLLLEDLWAEELAKAFS